MEDKMKILMTTDTVGGVWVYSVELCNILREFGVQVHLVAMGGWPSEEQEQEIATLDNTILYKSEYKLEWMQDPWEDVKRAEKWINCIYQTVHPDLVHFNNYAHAREDWTCPTITVFHSCVQTWWQAVKGTSAPSSWDRYKEVVKNSLNDSDVVIAPTQAILEKAKTTHGITSPMKVINNGRSGHYSSEKKEDIILCIGRIWDEGKNLKLLSKVAEELPWPVYIAGTNINPDTGQPVNFENIHFLGSLKIDEVKEWIEKASIFVSPTKYEPFGLAILEAAKAGCALVLSELETLKELWENDAAFFDPNNPREGKEKILQLIDNEDLRKDLAEKAQARSKEYSTEKMGQAYFDLYQERIDKTNQAKLLSV